jgi:hypothetical protein
MRNGEGMGFEKLLQPNGLVHCKIRSNDIIHTTIANLEVSLQQLHLSDAKQEYPNNIQTTGYAG